MGRLGFSDSISVGIESEAKAVPIFPEIRIDKRCHVSNFFINSRFQSEVFFPTLNYTILKKSFLVSVFPNLVYSPGQVSQFGRFRFLPAPIFPIFPVDLFLSSFFLTSVFRRLVKSP